MKKQLFILGVFCGTSLWAQKNEEFISKLDKEATAIESKLIQWRRHLHQYPELSNQEKKTGAYILAHLNSLGLAVQYPVAKTGVVAILKGGKPGPVVALRADMDALPITERNNLPFASKEKVYYNEKETGVMHACGHDAHVAMLMAVAEILTKNKSEIRGTIKFLFQPAEEGALPSEGVSGAELMIKEGVMENPQVDVVFGLHVQSLLPSGKIFYKPEGIMAAVDHFDITVAGKGAHGATPWDGIDPIFVGSQIVSGLQGVISRQTELIKAGVVVTIGSFHGGNRRNIIPETATMEGTIRTLDTSMQEKLHQDIRLAATNIAEAYHATAEIIITKGYPVTYNNAALTQQMLPTLQRVAGKQNVQLIQPVTMAEDFSFFQQKAPGLFFFLGVSPNNTKLAKEPVHHTADFMLDENALVAGVKALIGLTMDYSFQHPTKK